MPTRSRVLRSTEEASAAARRFLREFAGGRIQPAVLDDALLLSTELVTNAIRHAGSHPDDRIHLTVSIEERSMRVAVRDRGAGFDPAALSEPTDEGGWGLDLVRSLSSRWGVIPVAHGTEVWFEIHTEPPGT